MRRAAHGTTKQKGSPRDRSTPISHKRSSWLVAGLIAASAHAGLWLLPPAGPSTKEQSEPAEQVLNLTMALETPAETASAFDHAGDEEPLRVPAPPVSKQPATTPPNRPPPPAPDQSKPNELIPAEPSIPESEPVVPPTVQDDERNETGESYDAQPAADQGIDELLGNAESNLTDQSATAQTMSVSSAEQSALAARSLEEYGQRVADAISRQQRYPMAARRMGIEGVVRVHVRISVDGALRGEPDIRVSSGTRVLDQEALRMIRAAAPFPPLPPALQSTSVEIPIPIRFELR